MFHPSSSNVTLLTVKTPKFLSIYRLFLCNDASCERNIRYSESVLPPLHCLCADWSSSRFMGFSFYPPHNKAASAPALWVIVLLVLIFTTWEVTLWLTLPFLKDI